MTSSAPQKVNLMEPIDWQDREHRLALFDELPLDEDILMTIAEFERLANIGRFHGFILPDSCIWIEIDRQGIGWIHGRWDNIEPLERLIEYGFDALDLRKLCAEMPLYSRRDTKSATAERLLKEVGFQKRAILPEGLPNKDTILLDYLKRDHDASI